ncbi:rhodanese-like domain-containing protein [Anatilimnocola sp. NA78]|uniref:rhodanese-like domain-containing protein n=1 Tax=Anatilimnocola sp. NA78 TaxID=3415683 RepID=UPI003CE54280
MSLRLMTFVVVTLVAIVSSASEPTKDSLATIKKNVDEGKAVLVDVREKQEWDEGHVEGAILLSLSDLQKNGDLGKKLPKNKIIYTHCVVGKRCVAAGDILEKLGYEVRPLKPGYKELIESGFPKAKE